MKLDPQHDRKRWARILPPPLGLISSADLRALREWQEAEKDMARARSLLGCTSKALGEIFERIDMSHQAFAKLCARWTVYAWRVDSADLDKWVPGSDRDDWLVFSDLLLDRNDERGPWIAAALERREPIRAIALYYCASYGSFTLTIVTQFSCEKRNPDRFRRVEVTCA